MKKKYLIYNPDTGNCLTRVHYYDTIVGRKKLAEDLKNYQILKPQVLVGEVFLDDNDKVKETIPKDIKI